MSPQTDDLSQASPPFAVEHLRPFAHLGREAVEDPRQSLLPLQPLQLLPQSGTERRDQ